MNIPLAEEIAHQAARMMSARSTRDCQIHTPASVLVDVLEVYCGACRRPYDDVFDESCIPDRDTTHLRGGPIGERRKRKCPIHNCLYAECEGEHDSPTNYGRPPMPPLA